MISLVYCAAYMEMQPGISVEIDSEELLNAQVPQHDRRVIGR